MSVEIGKNSSKLPELACSETVLGVSLPENQTAEGRRQAVARPLARPCLGVAGDFANELAARIG